MKQKHKHIRSPVSTALRVLASLALVSVEPARSQGEPENRPEKVKGLAPATVENRVTEAALTTISLTPEAIARLAIKTVPARVEKISRRRLFGGETMVPPGNAIQLAAPFSGTITAIDGKATPVPGSMMKKGQPILRLQPVVMAGREVLMPSERISLARATADFDAARAQAEGEVSAAQVQLEAARARLDRVERLRKDNVTSEKLLDEAKAEHDLAKSRLEAAEAKTTAWSNAAQGMHADPQHGLDLVAPFDGILADLTVAPGEVIAASALVARLVAVNPLWIRVPIYVGALDELDLDGQVRVGGLNGRMTPGLELVERVSGAPSADPLSASVDVFFRLANPESNFRPQQRVGVWIPLREPQSGLVVPWSALLHDMHGGTWVYQQTQSQKFTRRRVEVRGVEGQDAIIARGLEPGMTIVTDGAAELFGVEFGAGK